MTNETNLTDKVAQSRLNYHDQELMELRQDLKEGMKRGHDLREKVSSDLINRINIAENKAQEAKNAANSAENKTKLWVLGGVLTFLGAVLLTFLQNIISKILI